jgi:PTH1 family peptidyl-tRNA hydrolase
VSKIKLIVGLANPGPQYQDTRHNAGAWFVEQLAQSYRINLNPEAKFFGLTGRGLVHQQDIRLLIPTTFMNLSGKAVSAMAQFFKLEPEEILVAHDELDINPGEIRLKKGGGHGGHNGLRDIISQLGNRNDFYRLRVGIGHPGDKNKVTGFVLGKPSAKERQQIDEAIDEAIRCIEPMVTGKHDQVMQRLHSLKPQ